MNSLRHFRYADNPLLALLLPCLRAPLLETLMIKGDYFSNELGTLPGNLFPEPYVFPSLRSLSLIDVISPRADRALYFAKMTGSVTNITFSQKDYASTLFATLQGCLKPDVTYWTKLKVITLDIDQENEQESVLRFTQARTGNGLVLHIFDFIVGRGVFWRMGHVPGVESHL